MPRTFTSFQANAPLSFEVGLIFSFNSTNTNIIATLIVVGGILFQLSLINFGNIAQRIGHYLIGISPHGTGNYIKSPGNLPGGPECGKILCRHLFHYKPRALHRNRLRLCRIRSANSSLVTPNKAGKSGQYRCRVLLLALPSDRTPAYYTL